MLRLRRLIIHRFRNVEPTELLFGDGHNFVLGKNGTGKTTLLNLIVLLLRGDLRPFLEQREELDVEMELEGKQRERFVFGDQFVRYEVEVRDKVRFTIDAGDAVGLRDRWGRLAMDARIFRKIVIVEHNTDPECLRSIPEEIEGSFSGVVGERAHVSFGGELIEISPKEMDLSAFFELPLPNMYDCVRRTAIRDRDEIGTRVLTYALLEGMKVLHNGCGRFDEALGLYQAILGVPTPNHDLAWAKPPEFIWRQGVPLGNTPSQVAKVLAAGLSEQPYQRVFDVSGAEPFVQLREALQATRVRASAKPASGTRDSVSFSGFGFEFHWSDGSFHGQDGLSFGQKRLLAFLWYASTLEGGPAITDELTNGLHVDWVYRCIAAMGGRQGFHAVQNPLLVDRAAAMESAEQLRRGFVFCSASFEGGVRRWVWRNPTVEEAEELDKALETGIQHLSEILMDRGLW